MILSIILFSIFTVLGGIHFYWVLGGRWGLSKAIPTKNADSPPPAIPHLATIFVGVVLVSFGLLYLAKSGLISLPIPDWITTFAYWFIPSIFVLRAIGEFNYVGFFKQIKHTEFARADSQLFSPLCLGIGLMGFFLQLV